MKRNSDYRGERLIVLSAPSAAGKNAAFTELKKRVPFVRRAVTVTTRKPRSDEKQGVDYDFVTVEEFERRFARGEFAERNGYDDHCYATPIKEITASDDEIVVLIIDVNGRDAIVKRYPCVTSVFLMPPSMDVLRERIVSRNQNSPEEIARRLEIAEREIAKADSYDHIVINDDLEACADELACIARAVWEKNQKE